MLNKKALSAARIASGTTTDADFEYVTMLLHGDGTNGAQNNTFIDGSTNNFTVTRNGNTTQGSLNPFGDRWSNYFDGSGDYFSVAHNANLNLSSGNWTIEAWVNWNGSNGYAVIISKDGLAGSTYASYAMNLNNSGYLQGLVGNGSGVSYFQIITSNTLFPKRTWTHCAFVKNGTTLTLYQNGTSVASATQSGTIIDGGKAALIGYEASQPSSFYMDGYISNLRVVKGTAVYTAAFTPPTAPLTAITNTQLLTCQSNRFVDKSSNNFTITRNGDVSVRPFSPFSPSAAYSTSTNGGSSYYGTTDSYITLPDNANLSLGSNNFTFELWFYKIANPGGGTNIIAWNTKNDNSAYAALRVQLTNTNTVDLLVSESGTSWKINASSSAVYVNNTWNHIAVVRNGGTITVYMNGTSVASGSTTASNTSLFAGTVNNINELYYNTNTWSMVGYVSNARLLIGTALYTAAFTPPTSPLTAITNTALLLNFTNGGIIDTAADNVLETVGNAQISTSVKKYGTGSLAFDGSGDWIAAPDNVEFSFGTGDFTIEAWVWLDSTVNPSRPDSFKTVTIFSTGSSSANDCSFAIYGNTSTAGVGLELYQASPSIAFNVAATVATNTWVHVAWVRSGTTIYGFVNGTRYTLGTTSASIASSVAPKIGAANSSGFTNQFKGYIDDFRVTKGIARYTANFTPPTAAFPDL